ncbi:MAG: hypothetical protein Q7S52_00450 [bacterium]|nr:hypothetical protein [bacterium]
MGKNTRELFLMLTIGILIGVSAVMVWTRGGWPKDGGDDASTAEQMVTNTSNGSSAQSISASPLDFPLPPSIPDNTRIGLSVADQPAGKMVTVSSIEVVGTKWIAIYDDNDGKPGWILGARRVHEGDTTATVELLRQEGAVAGGTYYAAILNDDGDDAFNRLTDLPPLSPDKVTIVRWMVK